MQVNHEFDNTESKQERIDPNNEKELNNENELNNEDESENEEDQDRIKSDTEEESENEEDQDRIKSDTEEESEEELDEKKDPIFIMSSMSHINLGNIIEGTPYDTPDSKILAFHGTGCGFTMASLRTVKRFRRDIQRTRHLNIKTRDDTDLVRENKKD